MNTQQFLTKHDVTFDVLMHEPTYDAQHLAHAVHVPGCEVAKTVLLRANHGYKYMLAVLPASRRIDFELASKSLGGCELHMATELEMANACPDCEIGALPPFGTQYGMETLVDHALANCETIVFEGNTHREAIRVRFADYCRLEQPLILPLSREFSSQPQGVA
jgi:Ala-tRNA(Pro) deacylase